MASSGAPLPTDHPPLTTDGPLSTAEKYAVELDAYRKVLSTVDFSVLSKDIESALTTSVDWWPADYGTYAPFFVRLAWHNAGSYRTSDGRGGADGARQRFEPERSWADNTNLDKARSLLWSVKAKWPEVSWGDLIMRAGNVAIESMGGPRLGFCAGRLDARDGGESELLGPSPAQESFAPCAVNGNCSVPLGSTTIGLIYLNPEGPMGQPDPEGSAPQIRDSFARMAMNDSETVALIGGGHSFGKTHGACPAGPGPGPDEAPFDPWRGLCGTGVGADAFTSGFEGPWTTDPTSWDVEYFHNLLDHEWEAFEGAGGHSQWRVRVASENPVARAAFGDGAQPTMMMTSDVALTRDASYLEIVQEFARDQPRFEAMFAHAWYKLTTRDMGPWARCVDTGDLPPPQPFQYPLPEPPRSPPDASELKRSVLKALTPGSLGDVARLAWACASTFRVTDYLGGCDGARVLIAPEKHWPSNAGLSTQVLSSVKEAYGESLSWADLIVVAGGAALELAAKGDLSDLSFCAGRADALEGDLGSQYLAPLDPLGDQAQTAAGLRELVQRSGLSTKAYLALLGARRSLGGLPPPYFGNATKHPDLLDVDYFKTLVDPAVAWRTMRSPVTGADQYEAVGLALYATPTDLAVRSDPEMLAIAQSFANDRRAFLAEIEHAWPALMNADRFGAAC